MMKLAHYTLSLMTFFSVVLIQQPATAEEKPGEIETFDVLKQTSSKVHSEIIGLLGDLAQTLFDQSDKITQFKNLCSINKIGYPKIESTEPNTVNGITEQKTIYTFEGYEIVEGDIINKAATLKIERTKRSGSEWSYSKYNLHSNCKAFNEGLAKSKDPSSDSK